MDNHEVLANSSGLALSVKQRRFVEEYTVDFNATQAAIRAGYSTRGAGVAGCRLLKNDKIADAVRSRVETLTMRADECLARLARMARGDEFTSMTEDSSGNERRHYDPLAALDKIAKAHRLYSDGMDVTIPVQLNFNLPTDEDVERADEAKRLRREAY